jgi:hypothetical protein
MSAFGHDLRIVGDHYRRGMLLPDYLPQQVH